MTDSQGSDRYVMRISRMTVDKLGVRLYDRVSAVVAELVANAYDADAENVVVRVPLATLLARKNRKTGEVEGYGYTIEVVDDGHGITEREANHHFLRVGKDRRADSTQGKRSRRKRRSVMGRKGIGKLAPFGICKRIEILSAGGDETEDGYPVSHFIMPYGKILADDDKPVPMEVGDQDGTYRSKRGTTVRLIDFLPKRVPNQEIFPSADGATIRTAPKRLQGQRRRHAESRGEPSFRDRIPFHPPDGRHEGRCIRGTGAASR